MANLRLFLSHCLFILEEPRAEAQVLAKQKYFENNDNARP